MPRVLDARQNAPCGETFTLPSLSLFIFASLSLTLSYPCCKLVYPPKCLEKRQGICVQFN